MCRHRATACRAATLGATRRQLSDRHPRRRLPLERPVADQSHDELQQPGEFSTVPDRPHSWEAKTDGTYFLSGLLGGDHSLKFGVGWRKNPIMSFSHYSGGARANVQCVGNNNANCGTGDPVAVGSAEGIVPYQAQLYRDQLRNNNWWTYNGYIQDSLRGRWRLNGGVRYDWQYSTYLGGCVPENVIMPTFCRRSAKRRPKSIRLPDASAVVQQLVAARVGDLRPHRYRKDVGQSRRSYYYDTRITLANNLGGLLTETRLTWGNNQSSGTCSTTPGAPCWTDANRDTIVQANELIGTPTSSSAQFVNGVLVPAGNNVDPSAQLGRTREAIVGIQHELISNLAIGVDYIYRKYDQGHGDLHDGYEPGAPGYRSRKSTPGP